MTGVSIALSRWGLLLIQRLFLATLLLWSICVVTRASGSPLYCYRYHMWDHILKLAMLICNLENSTAG